MFVDNQQKIPSYVQKLLDNIFAKFRLSFFLILFIGSQEVKKVKVNGHRKGSK